VLVDFWAPWCGPCRALAPMLDRLAHAYAGKFHVVKVNTDIEQELAARFQIRGIPAVKFFRDGHVVSEFAGVQPESAIKTMIDKFLPNETDELIQRAVVLTRDGDAAGAEAFLRDGLTRDGNNDRLKFELAKQLGNDPTDRPRVEEARALLDSLSIVSGVAPDVDALRLRLDLLIAALSAPPREELERVVGANGSDSRTRYQLAAHLAAADEYEPAMDQLLEIVRRDRSYRDDIARKTLVELFNSLGRQHPLSIEYRALLARVLN